MIEKPLRRFRLDNDGTARFDERIEFDERTEGDIVFWCDLKKAIERLKQEIDSFADGEMERKNLFILIDRIFSEKEG